MSRRGMVFTGEKFGKGFDEWMTPPDVLELARQAMGSIDFDPASNLVAQRYVKAKEFCDLEQYTPLGTYYEGIRMYDGLAQDWHGNVWCNPPYSAGNIDRFVDKAVNEWELKRSYLDEDHFDERVYEEKYVNQMLFLVNSATDARWYHKLLNSASCTLLWKGRIKFWKIIDGIAYEKWEGEKSKAEGKGKVGNSPRYLNTLFYFGHEVDRFKEVFKGKGTFMKLA